MDKWLFYALAWACFLGAHILPARPEVRGVLVARFGRRGYLSGFSLLSLLLLWWLIRAAGDAPFLPLWDAGTGARWLVNIAMPLAILCGVAGAGLSGLVLAFAIWAGAHLVANGDLAHVLFFGGMLVFAVAGLWRSGLPRRWQVTWLRLALAVVIWGALLHLHAAVIGVSPLPLGI